MIPFLRYHFFLKFYLACPGSDGVRYYELYNIYVYGYRAGVNYGLLPI